MSPTPPRDHDQLGTLRAEIDRLARVLAERDASIAEGARTLATSLAAREPMERHRARVRELEATLAEARRERDAVRAPIPATQSGLWTALSVIVTALLAVGLVFVGCLH